MLLSPRIAAGTAVATIVFRANGFLSCNALCIVSHSAVAVVILVLGSLNSTAHHM